MKIPFNFLGGEGFVPKRGSKKAACWDLFAAESAELRPFQSTLIPTYVRCALPENHVLLLKSRSGFSILNQILIPNSTGVIDEDFRGAMRLALMWTPDPVSVMQVELVERDNTRHQGVDFDVDVVRHVEAKLRYRDDAVFNISKGDRITQGLLVEYVEQEWEWNDDLPDTERGEGGLGSTGVRAGDADGK